MPRVAWHLVLQGKYTISWLLLSSEHISTLFAAHGNVAEEYAVTAECPEILDVKLHSLLHILFFSRCATSQLLSIWIWRSPGKGLAESKHSQLCNHGGGWRTDQAPQVQRVCFFLFGSFFPSPKSEICKWSNWHVFLLFYQNTSWCQVELS